ncbi:MAG: hypothetical protein K1X47_04840 [Cyclobacteriaceae bacterium]|nr:hypothetical protein [Cyclobacteriaceae bacterium]
MSFTTSFHNMLSFIWKWIRRILLTGLLLGLTAGAFLYFGTYEDGVRAGTIIRISEKGILFKTFEGQLNLETFGSLKNVTPIKETFEFSVESDQTEVIKALQEVALSGERVNVHYVKRYITAPWRGETKYFVTAIERGKH